MLENVAWLNKKNESLQAAYTPNKISKVVTILKKGNRARTINCIEFSRNFECQKKGEHRKSNTLISLFLTLIFVAFLNTGMNKIKINENFEWDITTQSTEVALNDKSLTWDLQSLPDGTFSILANGKSYNAIVEDIDRVTKQLMMKVNGNSYSLTIKEPIDQLLQKMGLNIGQAKKADAIKAPMPGLVLKILVAEGQQLKKGDPVLILEAMKMENVFKAPADAVVKAIKVVERKAVEKGEVLIELA